MGELNSHTGRGVENLKVSYFQRGMVEDFALIGWLIILCILYFSPILLALGILTFNQLGIK